MIPTLKTHRRNAPENKPVPSVVLPQPYKLLDPPPGSGGACGQGKDFGYFGTPLDNSAASLAIRAHEYGHLSIDRLQPQLDNLRDLAPPEWYQVGLDSIVNGYCEAVGVNISHLPISKKIPKDTPRLVRAIHALQTLSFKKTNKFAGLSDADVVVLQTASKKLRRLGQYCRRPEPTVVTSQRIAGILHTLDAYFGIEPTVSERTDLAGLLAHGLSEDGQQEAISKPQWVKCSIETRTLDKALHRKFLTTKRIAGFYGAFRNPLRTLLPAFDGQGWAMKRKRQGGTILLDQSGSMNLESSHVAKLLEDAPQATIAAYSGDSERNGTIRIYAQKGRYTSNVYTDYEYNSVDGPALDWLSKQSKPLIWISDGRVNGVGGGLHPLLSLECARKCQEHGILRVDSISRYFDLAGIKS